MITSPSLHLVSCCHAIAMVLIGRLIHFYPKRLTTHSGYHFFYISVRVPWELNPQPCALLMQCSTTEAQVDLMAERETDEHLIRKSYTVG